MKTLFHSAIVTSAIFLVPFFVSLLNIDFDFLDPLQQALKDFELTDIVYSQMMDESSKRIDTNIVIVNVGSLSRGNIAKVIDRVMQNKPKIAGVDVLFYKDTDPAETNALNGVLSNYDNIVLAEQLIRNLDGDVIEVRPGIKNANLLSKYHGYVNFPSEVGSFRTVRSVNPFVDFQNNRYSAFAVKLAELADSESVAMLSKRNNTEEIIDFQKLKSYVRVEYSQVLDTSIDMSFINNKIVLFGYLGMTMNDENSYEDRYFTPLNKRYAGKSFPDLFGVEIHGNILSMILSHDYVNSMNQVLNVIFSWIFCFVVVILFSGIEHKVPHYYDLISKTIQIIALLFLLFIVVFCFDHFRFRFDITLAAFSIALAADGYSIYISALTAREHKKSTKIKSSMQSTIKRRHKK
ncbi:MAG: CHASE2 domain-containing protein [Bacteroidetes bacterium]|nr:CHASE2 domain-containing protein [Bacteroidota bacterium]